MSLDQTRILSAPVRFLRSLRRNGPLATLSLSCGVVEQATGPGSLLRRPCAALRKWLKSMELFLDRRFDGKYGTDTSGIVPLANLHIQSDSVDSGIWYEPMPSKTFERIMELLGVSFPDYEFVDFGSGKGRVLLLASRHGFKKVIGVEFSEELHRIARANVNTWPQQRSTTSPIEIRCTDAVDFVIPDSPLVLFFFSPFGGRVMERVLGNIVESWQRSPRDLILVFHGSNEKSIELFRATGFSEAELALRPDWTHVVKHRTLVFRP